MNEHDYFVLMNERLNTGRLLARHYGGRAVNRPMEA